MCMVHIPWLLHVQVDSCFGGVDILLEDSGKEQTGVVWFFSPSGSFDEADLREFAGSFQVVSFTGPVISNT